MNGMNSPRSCLHIKKMYIGALNNWLRLNLIPIESNLKEKVSSPPKTIVPPIYDLLQAWHSNLDQLPFTIALQIIKSFAAIIQKISAKQQEELKQKKVYEDAQAEFDRKNKAYEEIEAKYLSEIKRSEENDGVQTEPNNKDPLTERKIALDILEKRAKEEK